MAKIESFTGISGKSSGKSSGDCWVDIFEADYFMGRKRRLTGPQKLRQLKAKSLIVGPKAAVVLTVFRGNRKSVIRLKASAWCPIWPNPSESARHSGKLLWNQSNEVANFRGREFLSVASLVPSAFAYSNTGRRRRFERRWLA